MLVNIFQFAALFTVICYWFLNIPESLFMLDFPVFRTVGVLIVFKSENNSRNNSYSRLTKNCSVPHFNTQ